MPSPAPTPVNEFIANVRRRAEALGLRYKGHLRGLIQPA